MVPVVAVFMTVWLSLAAAFFVAGLVIAFRDPPRWWFPLIAIAFFAFGYLFMTLAFSFEARRIRTNITLLVTGTPAADLPRTDLSWLMDFRLRDAEVPDRRFNRVFLTTYAVSGALVVLAWDRTVAACPNFHDPRHEYSCPSGARIALTWILGVVLVAAGLASRVALHKRARRAYIPFVVLVAALGAVAAWLMTHHPHWGVVR